MKLVLALLLLYSLTCQAQVVTIPEAAEPTHAFYIIGAGPYLIDTFLIDYETVDTFDNREWNPIYQLRYTANDNMLFNSYPRQVAHQRIENEKVYFREEDFFDGIKEGLLYDFGVEAGDSIWALSPSEHCLGLDSLLHVIDSVKYYDCNFGDSVKVIFHTAIYDYPDLDFTFYTDVWIEGVGSAWHGYYPFACVNTISPLCEILHLNHYAFIDNQWIEPRDILCEEILTSLTNINRKRLQTLISPNPVHKNGMLTIEAIDYRLDRVAVFDISGRQLLDVFSESPQSLQLDLAGLGSGIYVVKAYSTSGAVDVRKVVVR
ncbi:MAG: T9SS type A sorting domain-containing protein [Bacteroidota bacterium]